MVKPYTISKSKKVKNMSTTKQETTKKTVVVNGMTIGITFTSEELAAYKQAELDRLQARLAKLQSMSDDETAIDAANTLKGKLSRMQKDGKEIAAWYSFTDLKASARTGDSLAAYLREQGIAETLIGSADRGYKQLLVSVTALKVAGITDKKAIETSCRAALGKTKVWSEHVIAYLLAHL